ncbi:MAG: putative quinol monooxygenase [Bacillota bacterium]
MLTLVAKFRAKEGKEQELAALCKELAKTVTANEEGCLMYVPYVAVKDPAQIVYVEQYKDKDALKIHGNTEYFQATFPKMQELMDGPGEILFLKEIE